MLFEEWSLFYVFAACDFLLSFLLSFHDFIWCVGTWMLMLVILMLLLGSRGASSTSGSSMLQPNCNLWFLFYGIGCYRISYRMSCSCFSLKSFNHFLLMEPEDDWHEYRMGIWICESGKISFRCCPLALYFHPLFFVFFFENCIFFFLTHICFMNAGVIMVERGMVMIWWSRNLFFTQAGHPLALGLLPLGFLSHCNSYRIIL